MKRRIKNWSLVELYEARSKIQFPEYQRQANLWSDEKKRLLIDSIFKNIDIPKLYFNVTKGGYEVVDGQQRLWAIWEFLDDAYSYYAETRQDARVFSELAVTDQKWIKGYELQITELQDADDEYLRTLFIRLQLGLLLITGEKLHALSGAMKEFVFAELQEKEFVKDVAIPSRRFAKETLCAQICINSFYRSKLKEFARTRYEDLEYFFKEYSDPQGVDRKFFDSQRRRISKTFDALADSFGPRAKQLKNRSYILSIYVLFEDGLERGEFSTDKQKKVFADFVISLWRRLREEVGAGFDRKNRELYTFENLISSAPGEKYQIKRRDEKMREYYAHFERTGKIEGDK